ncbi:MAG: hypothetical protein HOP35_09065 [Nitrospira sp.]|nr:hypothetical protein [Nitrospira sp.]
MRSRRVGGKNVAAQWDMAVPLGRQGGDVLARCLVKNNQERILSGRSSL